MTYTQFAGGAATGHGGRESRLGTGAGNLRTTGLDATGDGGSHPLRSSRPSASQRDVVVLGQPHPRRTTAVNDIDRGTHGSVRRASYRGQNGGRPSAPARRSASSYNRSRTSAGTSSWADAESPVVRRRAKQDSATDAAHRRWEPGRDLGSLADPEDPSTEAGRHLLAFGPVVDVAGRGPILEAEVLEHRAERGMRRLAQVLQPDDQQLLGREALEVGREAGVVQARRHEAGGGIAQHLAEGALLEATKGRLSVVRTHPRHRFAHDVDEFSAPGTTSAMRAAAIGAAAIDV